MAGAAGGNGEPDGFRQAVEAVRNATVRPGVVLEEMPAPRGLAPHSAAFAAEVVDADDAELASGRIVLLHDPRGHEAWEGDFRVVTLTRAELEPELATDPLLPEVGWSWLEESLHARRLAFRAPSGTVTRATSQGFGGLADQISRTEIEIRASWTPDPYEDDSSPGELSGGGVNLVPHLLAWIDLLCTCAGLPPAGSEDEAGEVVSMRPHLH